MNDLLNILTTAEGQMRAASRECFRASAARAAKGATDEANVCAAAGMSLGDKADQIKAQAEHLREGVRLREAQKSEEAREKEAARLLGVPVLKVGAPR